MKKLLLYILVCAWLFSWLDWQSIKLTRFTHPEWTEWMHAHEILYADITVPLEYTICAPALALKPIFGEVLKRVDSTEEQQHWITHAPPPDWRGFYLPIVRGQPYVFVPWWAWILSWLPKSVLWYYGMKKAGLITRLFFCLEIEQMFSDPGLWRASQGHYSATAKE